MTDIVDTRTRSRMMSAIKGRDTAPEMVVKRFLHRFGFRFRLHKKQLPGRPDLVLPRWHAVIFVHGCFWHRHQGCKFATTPATRPDFWQRKFAANVQRDERQVRELKALGWKVAVIWECEVGSEDRLRRLVEEITNEEG
ncbi:very short patch repair endonuclease [Chromobacterium sinusclupearum]|uniref:Very short patch repair endonuclease n=1 Tax=Chromobacterium sinusclupearum TaxID=2077146 RepID=A0A2K4MT73_9NEIS|nr:DNA mismatch endonuclease Vsr [Chromobacterium sinusclupearum]POB00312.1 very short patch repair endonuclease [Chromobacterium sinusclupearum]